MVKKSAIALILVSVVLLFFFGIYKSDLIYAPPFETEFALQNVELAVADLERNIVFYDRAKKMLTKFDQHSLFVWTKKFNEIVIPADIAVERSGDIYILNNIPPRSNNEHYQSQILKIDKMGETIEVLFTQTMDTTKGSAAQLRPVFQDLRVQNNELTWFETGSMYITFHAIDLLSERHQSEVLLENNSEVSSVLTMARLGKKFFASLIGGRFCQIEDARFKKTDKDFDQLVMPWWIGVRGDDLIWNELSDFSLYTSNLEKHEKRLIFNKVRIGQVQALESAKEYKKITLSDKYLTLVFSDSISVTDLTNGNHSNIYAYKLTELQAFQLVSQYLFLVEVLFLLGVLLRRLLTFVLRRGVSLLALATVLVAIVQSGLFFVFAFVDQTYISSFELMSYKAGLDNISSMMASKFPVRVLSEISYTNYEAANYYFVISYVDSQSSALKDNALMVVYKLEAERIRVVYASNRGMGLVQVSPDFDDPSKVFWKALQGNTVSREVPTSWGQMLGSISPIRDSGGKVIGLLEYLKPLSEIEEIQQSVKQERNQNLLNGTVFLNLLLIALIIVYKLLKPSINKKNRANETAILELKKRDRRISYLIDVVTIFQKSVQEFYERMSKKHKENNLYYVGFEFVRELTPDTRDQLVSDFIYEFAPHVAKNKVIFALLKSRDLVASIMQEFDAFKLAMYNLNIASSEILKKRAFVRLRMRSIAYYHFSPKITHEVFNESLITSNNLCSILKKSDYFGTFLIVNADSEVSSNMTLLRLCKCRFKNANGYYIVYEIIDGLQFESRKVKSVARDSVEQVSKLVDALDFVAARNRVIIDPLIPAEMKRYFLNLFSFYLATDSKAPQNEFAEDFLAFLEQGGLLEGHS